MFVGPIRTGFAERVGVPSGRVGSQSAERPCSSLGSVASGVECRRTPGQVQACCCGASALHAVVAAEEVCSVGVVAAALRRRTLKTVLSECLFMIQALNPASSGEKVYHPLDLEDTLARQWNELHCPGSPPTRVAVAMLPYIADTIHNPGMYS